MFYTDNTEATVGTEIERLPAAVDLDTVDHTWVDGCGWPDIFRRAGAVKIWYAVDQKKRIPVGAAIDADGELTLIRRVADVSPANETGRGLPKVCKPARLDLLGVNQLHLVAKLNQINSHVARCIDAAAFHKHRAQPRCIIFFRLFRLCSRCGRKA